MPREPILVGRSVPAEWINAHRGLGGMFSADRNPFNVDDPHSSSSSSSSMNGWSPLGAPGTGTTLVNNYVTPPDRIRQDPLRLLFQQLQHDEHSGGLVDSPENALIYNLLVRQYTPYQTHLQLVVTLIIIPHPIITNPIIAHPLITILSYNILSPLCITH